MAAPVSFLYATVVQAAAMDGNLPMLIGNNNNNNINNNNTYGLSIFLNYLFFRAIWWSSPLTSLHCMLISGRCWNGERYGLAANAWHKGPEPAPPRRGVGACVTGRLDVCRYLVEEKGFHVISTSTEGTWSHAPRALLAGRAVTWAGRRRAPAAGVHADVRHWGTSSPSPHTRRRDAHLGRHRHRLGCERRARCPRRRPSSHLLSRPWRRPGCSRRQRLHSLSWAVSLQPVFTLSPLLSPPP